MFFSGILTAVGFVAIAAKFSPTILQRALGYDWVVDLLMTLGLMWLFGSTGTISGMMIGVITGLCISAVLYFVKNVYKYQKYEKKDGTFQWVTYPGKWTPAYLAKNLRNIFDGLDDVIYQVKKGWNDESLNSCNTIAA